MKKKATCEDIKKLVKILKKHEIKPDKDGLITIRPAPRYTRDFKNITT